MPWG
jgi:hypothetical protein